MDFLAKETAEQARQNREQAEQHRAQAEETLASLRELERIVFRHVTDPGAHNVN